MKRLSIFVVVAALSLGGSGFMLGQQPQGNVYEVGKEEDAPEPPKNAPLTDLEIHGDWKAEKIGEKETPIDDLYIHFDEKGATIAEGKYKDWKGGLVHGDGEINFYRKPKAEEMSGKAPPWAREKVAAEGKLEWKLALKAESRKGEWVLEGKWYPGQFKWEEKGEKKEAWYLDEGKPVDVKFKKNPVIVRTVVLNNQTGFNNGLPWHPYPFVFRPPPGLAKRGSYSLVAPPPRNGLGQEGDERTLFICGVGLPTNYEKKIEIRGGDNTVKYLPIALATDNNLSADNKRLFKAGWDVALRGLDPDTEKSVRKCAAMLVRADLQRGVVTGVKSYTLNNTTDSWRLRFGDNGGLLTFARDVTSNDNEDIDCASLPEKIYIEIRTETPFPTQEIPLRVRLNNKAVKWNGSDTIVAKYVKDVGTASAYEVPRAGEPAEVVPKVVRVYRTPTIQLGGESSSAGKGFHLNGKVEDVLRAEPDDPYLFRLKPAVAKVKIWDTPDRDAAANLIGTWRETIDRAAYLDGLGDKVKAGKNVAGSEGASISNVVVSNIPINAVVFVINLWPFKADFHTRGKLRPVKDAWTETTSHWTSLWPPAFAWRFFFGDRGIFTERVSITVADHAALLLFKEAFIRKMSIGLDFWEEKTEAQSNPQAQRALLLGLRETLKAAAAKESSPWESIRVPGPNGGEVKLSWALDDGLRKAACKNMPDAAADEWSLEAVENGLDQYKAAIKHAIEKAKDTPDNDVRKLIELIGYGYENLAPEVMQHMMWHPPGSSAGQNWEPNLNARWRLWRLHTGADAIRAQEDLSKLDTQMMLLAASAFAAPVMLSESAFITIASYAFDAATLGHQLISETVPELWEQSQREEIRFAIGASLVLGTERLNEAELKKTDWFQTVLNVLPSAMGVTMGAEGLHAMTRANAKAKSAFILELIEKHGLDGTKRLTNSQKQALLIAASEAEVLKEMGAAKAIEKSNERAAVAAEKLASEAGVSRAARSEADTNVVKATGNPTAEKPAEPTVGPYASAEEKTNKPASIKEPEQKVTQSKDATGSVKETEGVSPKDATGSVKESEPIAKDATGSVKEGTESVKEGTGTVKDAAGRQPAKPRSRAAENLDEIEALVAARGDKDPEQNPVNAQMVLPDNTAETFEIGRHRGKGQFATVYDIVKSRWLTGEWTEAVLKLVWDGDIFRASRDIARDMIDISKKLTDAKILHLKIRGDIPGCVGAKTMKGDPMPFVVQQKLPDGARIFSEGTDPNVIVGFLRQKGRGRATAKLFWQLKEAGLVLEDPRVVNLFWQEINGEWVCGILDVDRVIPFRERNSGLGKVIDWVEAHVSGHTVKSLYAARRRAWNNPESAAAFANRTANAPPGPYFPDAEFFMEKMFEHKNWLECDLINAAGEVVPPGTPLSEVKGVRYRNGFITIEDVREFFPDFDDPARWKALDLRNPYDWKGTLLNIPNFIFRIAVAPRVHVDLAASRCEMGSTTGDFAWPGILLQAA